MTDVIDQLWSLADGSDQIGPREEGDAELGDVEHHQGRGIEVDPGGPGRHAKRDDEDEDGPGYMLASASNNRYPGATWRPLPQNSTQSRITPRTIVLHTAVSNGTSLYNFFNGRSAGVESHHYLRQNGTAEQYMAHNVRADCQRDGNSFSISVESWDGYGRVWTNERDLPAWNTAQVTWLVAYLRWCNSALGIPLRDSQRWNDSGVAWHNKYIGNPGFAASARACPGSRRIAQIPGLVAAARSGGNELTAEDRREVRRIIGEAIDARFGR